MIVRWNRDFTAYGNFGSSNGWINLRVETGNYPNKVSKSDIILSNNQQTNR